MELAARRKRALDASSRGGHRALNGTLEALLQRARSGRGKGGAVRRTDAANRTLRSIAIRVTSAVPVHRRGWSKVKDALLLAARRTATAAIADRVGLEKVKAAIEEVHALQ